VKLVRSSWEIHDPIARRFGRRRGPRGRRPGLLAGLRGLRADRGGWWPAELVLDADRPRLHRIVDVDVDDGVLDAIRDDDGRSRGR
jgi:hypothetical protein